MLHPDLYFSIMVRQWHGHTLLILISKILGSYFSFEEVKSRNKADTNVDITTQNIGFYPN